MLLFQRRLKDKEGWHDYGNLPESRDYVKWWSTFGKEVIATKERVVSLIDNKAKKQLLKDFMISLENKDLVRIIRIQM